MNHDMQAEFNRTFSEFHLWLAIEAPRIAPTCIEDYKMYAFTQSWSDSSCGFGGMAAQSFTDALTVVFRHGNFAVVFIAGRYAYHLMINEVENFREDLSNFTMAAAARKGNNYITRYTKKAEVV